MINHFKLLPSVFIHQIHTFTFSFLHSFVKRIDFNILRYQIHLQYMHQKFWQNTDFSLGLMHQMILVCPGLWSGGRFWEKVFFQLFPGSIFIWVKYTTEVTYPVSLSSRSAFIPKFHKRRSNNCTFTIAATAQK